jgi:hypothetical protein
MFVSPAMPAVAEQLAPNTSALDVSIPAFSPAVKQAQPYETFWGVAGKLGKPENFMEPICLSQRHLLRKEQ